MTRTAAQQEFAKKFWGLRLFFTAYVFRGSFCVEPETRRAAVNHHDAINRIMTLLVRSEGQLTESEASRMVGVSPRRFRGIFVERFGEPFRVVRLAIRMEAARKRLLETTDSISAISAQLGYSERDKLERSFKERFQVTPAQYREYYRKNILRNDRSGHGQPN
jgi:AraC-like DNA-binding protein